MTTCKSCGINIAIYGVCASNKGQCSAQEMGQADGRDNVAICMQSTKDLAYNANSTPSKVDAPPLGYFEDFLEYARTVLIPWTLGIALGAVLMLVFLMGFNPLGS